ncbi:MAG: VanZ family protein [Flavobacteriaceae bacterium]
MRQLIHRWLQADLFFKIVAILATLEVIYLSLKPLGPVTEYWTFLYFRQDIILHFVCYFSLTVIYFAAFFTHSQVLKKAFLISFFIGFILECFQLIPYFERTFDYADLIANLIGSSLGILIIRFFFFDSVK